MKQLYKSYNQEIKGYASDPDWNSDAEMLPKNPKKEAIAINAIKSDLNHFKSDLITEMNKFKNDNSGTNPILSGISINTGLFGNKTKLTGGTNYKLSHIPFDGTGRYVSVPINNWINTIESFSQDYDQIFWEYDRKYASESYFKSIDNIRKSFKCEDLLKQAWMLPLSMK